ncbi:MAG: hypothetical protein H6619_06490 [Deltaproteobacteria bacterium]|nr:hypothetical protein [Deltaproteobacteria bacterium]
MLVELSEPVEVPSEVCVDWQGWHVGSAGPRSATLLHEPSPRYIEDGVLTTDRLYPGDLEALASGDLVAIRIPKFLGKQKCRDLAKFFNCHPNRDLYGQNVADPSAPGGVRYLNFDVDKVGVPRNTLIGKCADSLEAERYFAGSEILMDQVREICGGVHPIERVIAHANEVYIDGAERERIFDREAFVGIGRITNADKGSVLTKLPHVDGPWKEYTAHLSVNVYLRASTKGGELEVLTGKPLSAQEVAAVGPEHDFRVEDYSPRIIHPRRGDAIFINTRLPHAVSGINRISISSFLGIAPNQPIKFYS